MFRKIKKKPSGTLASKRQLDDDDDDEQQQEDPMPASTDSLALNTKKARRVTKGLRAGTTTTTGGLMTADPTTDRTTVLRSAPPRGAYGGAPQWPSRVRPMDTTNDDDDDDTAVASNNNNNNITMNRYDPAALYELRQAQQTAVPQVTPPDDWNNNNANIAGRTNNDKGNPKTTMDDDDEDVFGMGRNFIPIDESADSIRATVLAGDDALAYADADEDDDPSASRNLDAVLGNLRQQRSVDDTPQPPPASSTSLLDAELLDTMPSLTLQDVHQQFSRTQERLQQQAAALEKSLLRRSAARQDAAAQVQTHQRDLQSTGSSLEFYQRWRRDLIAFVGALREITKALPDMQNAWHELEQDMAGMQKWRDWEDDTFAVLTRYRLLQSVVGRQPMLTADLLLEEAGPAVDEFGRDVVSQKQRILQQRRIERRKIRKEAVLESGVKPKMGAESSSDGSVSPHLNNNYAYPTGYPVLASPSEMESFRERNTALQHALNVVLDGLYEEYTSLQQLFELFAQWKRSFPAEYKECYASLTLADLATVLILVELLSLNDPLNESGGHDEAKWITTVCRHYEGDGANQNTMVDSDTTCVKLFDKESIERLVSKAVLPTLQDMLTEKRTYNLLSARQSKALSGFFTNANRLLPQDHPVLRMLYKVVVDYIEQSLQDLSIPLIVQEKTVLDRLAQIEDPEEKELLGQTIHDATMAQIERVKKIMLNLFDCWATILPADCGLPSVILQFMASKVVPLLSALQSWYWPSLAESPADIFLQLWQEVQKYDWLDRPENMIYSTVLKATAEAFRVDPAAKDESDDTAMDDLASDPIIQKVN